MKKDVAVVEHYAIQEFDANTLKELVSEAAGPGGLQLSDLDRVKIPSGGGVSWTVPTLDGEESVKELTGIILHHQDVRAYWSKSIDEGGGDSPPDCASPDGQVGMGDPGGPCSSCPLAKFGSATKGKGQACKQVKVLYLLPPEALLPLAVTLAPTSIKGVKQYLLRLASRAKKPQEVITAITLEKAKNADGIPYSVAKPAMKGQPDDKLAALAACYTGLLKQVLGKVDVSADDVNG